MKFLTRLKRIKLIIVGNFLEVFIISKNKIRNKKYLKYLTKGERLQLIKIIIQKLLFELFFLLWLATIARPVNFLNFNSL